MDKTVQDIVIYRPLTILNSLDELNLRGEGGVGNWVIEYAPGNIARVDELTWLSWLPHNISCCVNVGPCNMAHSTWSAKTLLSQIDILEPIYEHLVKSEGGVLYLFEAKTEANAQGY